MKDVADEGWAIVFGAPAMEDAGKLVAVLAGDGEDADRVKPYLNDV